MTSFKPIFVLLLLWIPATVYSDSLDLDDYDLVFNDEFNSGELDAQKWATRHIWGSFTPINAEEQYYVDTLDFDSGFGYSPFVFTDSSLIIRADEITSVLPAPSQPVESSSHWSSNPDFQFNPDYDPDERQYFSGIISSYESFNFTHGYAETRAKVPAGKGLWSAFWLLTSKYVEDVPELDIMEALGEFENEVNHTLHYFDIGNGWQLVSSPTYKTTGQNFTDSFHTYGVLWEPNKITWFVDDVAVKIITKDDFLIAKQSMYLIANLAVGGNWPGSPDSTTTFPADYELDYIRVYRKKPIETITPSVLANDYQLMFADEFDGNSLDATKWDTSYLWGPFYQINNEQQYYLDKHGADAAHPVDPFDVSNGSLKITAAPVTATELPDQPSINDPFWQTNPSHQYNSTYKQPNGWTPDYTSGVLTSYDSFKFVHGYVEASIKVPEGAGLWPAFWLLNGYYVGPMPEIDIMEMQGEAPNIAHHSYHYHDTNGDLVSSAETSSLPGNASFADDFHTFGVQWDRDKITWYVDGVKTRTLQGSEASTQLMYILVNLAVGGNFVGAVDPTGLPATMEVDYIRAYQRKNSTLIAAPADDTAPVTAISNPTENNAVLAPAPQIQGTVYDDNPLPVASVEVNIRDTVNQVWVGLDGTADPANPWRPNFITPDTPTNGFSAWSIDTTLPAGRYDLFVRALDAANNQSNWERRQFTVGYIDNTAPVTSISNPAVANTVLAPAPQIQGTVFDDNPAPVISVEVNIRDTANQQWVRTDGSADPLNPWVPNYITPDASTDGEADWSLQTSLPAGRYDLFIRALDAANNQSAWQRRQFTVGFADNVAPVTAISNPSVNNAVLSPAPQIQGTVFDDNPSPVISVEVNIRDTVNHLWVKVDGTADPLTPWVPNYITPDAATNGTANWSLATTLPTGRYDLFVRALDAANNHSQWERRKFSIGFSDNTAPVTSVLNPSANNMVLPPAPLFEGTVFDDNALPDASVEVNIRDIVNHTWVELDGSVNTSPGWDPFFITPNAPTNGLATWSLGTSLSAGTYRLYVRAQDAAAITSAWETVQFTIAP